MSSGLYNTHKNNFDTTLDLTRLKRWQVCLINIGLMLVLCLPAVFSLNIWADAKVLEMGFLDLEDFIVSNLLLPIGSICYVLFCTTRYGWGWKSFFGEVNTGNGLKLPRWIRGYMTYVLPVVILGLMIVSLVTKFAA